MFDDSPVLIITGPTACGKTAVSEMAAIMNKGEIISADSRLFHSDLNIGTAKYTISRDIPYHMVDLVKSSERFTVKDFLDMGRKKLSSIKDRGHLPIVTGGSMLFVERFIKGMDPSPPPNRDFRKSIREIIDREGYHKAHEILEKENPEIARGIHPNNTKAVIRALERSILEPPERSEGRPPLENFRSFFLTMDRDILFERIELRLEEMLEKGWIREVENLIDRGAKKDDPGLESTGYPQILGYIQGNLSRKEMFDEILRVTRRLAIKQIKWIKRIPCEVIDMGDRLPGEVADTIIQRVLHEE